MAGRLFTSTLPQKAAYSADVVNCLLAPATQGFYHEWDELHTHRQACLIVGGHLLFLPDPQSMPLSTCSTGQGEGLQSGDCRHIQGSRTTPAPIGEEISAGRLLVPGISDGTFFLKARAADYAAAKRVSLRQSCLWIRSPFPPQPTWWSPKGSAALSPMQRGHLDSPSLIFSPSQ